MGVLALSVGLAMPAAAVVEVVGRTVRFDWFPATGPLIGYQILLSRNGGPEEVFSATVAERPWVTVYGAYGDEVRVRVVAFDSQLDFGPPSQTSALVRFVETASPDSTTGGGSGSTTDPDPTTDPGTGTGSGSDPVPALPPATLDFDGDGLSDLVIRDDATGESRVIHMDGSAPIGASTLAPHPPDVVLVGNGDYNGDRLADAAWLDEAAGELIIELTDPAAPPDGMPLDASVVTLPVRYWFGGSADFDGDGRDDLVVADRDTNRLEVWMMDGVAIDRVQWLGDPRLYQPIGAGDFDGDGRAEFFAGSAFLGKQLLRGIAPDGSGWSATYWESLAQPMAPIGVGDHDGDGIDDILWLAPDTGAMESWSFNPQGRVVRHPIDRALPAGAQAIGSGDYDGDGRAEIAVREAPPGGLVIWFLDGSNVVDIPEVSPISDSWSLSGAGGEAPLR